MLDRNMAFHVDQKVVGTTVISFAVPNDTYIMIYNTHSTATITVRSGFGDSRGISVGPGKKRTIPRLSGQSSLWIVSDAANTTVQLWRSSTKWGSEWFADEDMTIIESPIVGDPYANDGDPLNAAGTPIVIDFLTTYGTSMHFLSLIPNVDIDITITYEHDATTATVRVLAGETFTFGPETRTAIQIISYVNAVGGENFEFRGFAY